ncbi:hypothetical protein [Variovorax sp. V15]|uniref:hypothetical protein n=1 Tax=Variovorax sp. V15 TaxID=3065952 RepID=UPI0034E87402
MKPASKTRVRRAPNGAVSDKPVAVRLHPDELERFKSRAAREQRSMASVVRLAALRGLDECDRTNTPLTA